MWPKSGRHLRPAVWRERASLLGVVEEMVAEGGELLVGEVVEDQPAALPPAPALDDLDARAEELFESPFEVGQLR